MDTDEDLVDSERLLLELTKKMNSEAGTLFRKGIESKPGFYTFLMVFNGRKRFYNFKMSL